MPVTRAHKERASQPQVCTRKNAQQNATSGSAGTSKAPRSRPSRPIKKRERVISNVEDDEAPVTPVTNGEVEPLESRASVDELAALQGKPSKRWVRQLIHNLIAQLAAVKAELASAQQARDEAVANLNRGSHVSDIVAIEKPCGEAGDKRKGFVLIKAMGLDGSTKDREQYKAMLVSSCSHQRFSVATLSSAVPFLPPPGVTDDCRPSRETSGTTRPVLASTRCVHTRNKTMQNSGL
jgi:hypothetical protein